MRSVVSIVLMIMCASFAGYAQVPDARPASQSADFNVQVWGDIAADFSMRIASYVELRSQLEQGLPPLQVTDDPGEITRAERALARRIRVARAKAKRGDIFTPAVTGAFRKALLVEMDAQSWAFLMDDNPGAFSVRINGTYPAHKPLSAVPPRILAALPALPDTIQYRFLGRHLVLFDTKARVILDRLPYAIRPAADLPSIVRPGLTPIE
jgi:hypothetical protein